MKSVVLVKIDYKGNPCLITQFGSFFQYFFEFNGELYGDFMDFRPNFKRWILWKLGLEKELYSEQEKKDAQDLIVDVIVRSVDLLNSPEKRAEVEKKRQSLLTRKRYARDSKCFWQTRSGEDKEPRYYCLLHDIEIPFTEEYPKHD